MIFKTQGIVFRLTKFKETSIIVNIFTAHFGMQSYIVNGVRSKTARNKIALYQPLTLLNLVVYHRGSASIERIKEVSIAYPYQSLISDIRKSTIALFLDEVLNKTIRDDSHSQEVFEFLYYSFVTLDKMATGYENFHLVFLIKLSRFLGFGAQNVNEIMGGRVANESVEKLVEALLVKSYDSTLTITQQERRELLDLIVKFYADHIDIGELKSMQVLRDVLS